jgi:signal transduction histidine kinase/DNA-binding response OmpR family regulator
LNLFEDLKKFTTSKYSDSLCFNQLLFTNQYRFALIVHHISLEEFHIVYNLYKLIDIKLYQPELQRAFYIGIGNMYEVLGDIKNAINYKKKAINASIANNYFYFQIAVASLLDILLKAKQYEKAIKYYEKYKSKITPDGLSDVLLPLSYIYIKYNKFEKAKYYFEQIVYEKLSYFEQNKYKLYESIIKIKELCSESTFTTISEYIDNKSSKLNTYQAELAFKSYETHQPALELKENEIENLNNTNQILAEKSETKDRLLSQLSHEIRTPLSIILGNTNQLYSEIDNKETIEKVKSIHRNSLNLLNQIDAVLEYNKLESGTRSNITEDCDIIEMIQNSIQDFSILTQSKSIEVIFTANVKKAHIQIDIEKLQKIFNNLLSNAIKYNIEKGQIFINLKLTKNELWLQVKDTGLGMDSEHIPYLFNKYYQIQQNSFIEGFGVGLNVVHSLLMAMEGKIDVNSTLNKGSSFTISIPISLPTNIVKGKSEIISKNNDKLEAESTSTFLIEQDKSTILLVEDNQELRQFIKSFLLTDYNCIEASNGEDAYKLILDYNPDIILSDYMMPRMNGIELLEKVRNNPDTSHHYFVMLTADNLEKTKFNIIKKGADAFISKPFNEDELKSILDNINSKQQLLREKFNSQDHFSKLSNKILSKNEVFTFEIYKILEENYMNEELTPQYICQSMHLSVATLQRKTKSILKESPIEVITNFRLKKAKVLIQNNTGNISEIGYQCGFNSPQYFSRVFKEKYGMSPSRMIAR